MKAMDIDYDKDRNPILVDKAYNVSKRRSRIEPIIYVPTWINNRTPTLEEQRKFVIIAQVRNYSDNSEFYAEAKFENYCDEDLDENKEWFIDEENSWITLSPEQHVLKWIALTKD